MPSGVDVVLSVDYLPELGFDRVPTLPMPNVKGFMHCLEREKVGSIVKKMEKRNGYEDNFSRYEE